MFFRITNSPATFQAMMNEILRDLINEGKVAAFVDDVLVGTETEEGHNEIVKKILRRLEENDLYVKPEKCVKRVFTTKPVLAAPDLDKEFRVEADASNYATGGVLSMKCSDDRWRPVAFISKSLSDTKRNYEIHDKEMLAIVRCLEA